ncbi:hypothetical protein N0B31_11200 [Salinirubellus salinus]|uniref:Uncharacterized protein n=1 Tax=Salinirubellus salinus TaxID=1364945 RepID=A0A9E7R0M0_9EURY|nr:hypothetical protein [Salinirubellus salinus]UWM52718.1 hypothetical protein N0B31_11200 [Salinirubellus salinus]
MEVDERGDRVWVTRLSRVFVDRSPLGAVPTILLTVGLVPFVLTALFLGLTGLDVRPVFLGSQLLAATLTAVGSVLVWRYDTVVFPTFIERATEVTPYDDNRELRSIATRYRDFFTDVRATTAVWTGLVLLAVVVNDGYFASLGVTGYTDPAYLAYLLFAAWTAAITAVGIRMAFTTNLCIREIGELDFSIDPLHPDGLGGLSNIGYFAIRTTTLFSIGALGLPLAFDVVRVGGGSGIVYLLVASYIAMIVGSFVFPTVYINRRANEIKSELLNEKREHIHELRAQLLAGDDPEEIETLQMKLDELRTQYETYDRVSLYPMSLSIASRLVSSVLLPLFFVVVETYVI